MVIMIHKHIANIQEKTFQNGIVSRLRKVSLKDAYLLQIHLIGINIQKIRIDLDMGIRLLNCIEMENSRRF